MLVAGAVGVLAVAALVVVLLRGGGDGALGADPARVTPPRIALYADVSLRPTGEQGANARKLVARAVGARETGARLATLVGRAVDGGRGRLDYRRDVEPWIGGRVGVFFRSLAGPRSRGMLVVAARDAGGARAAIVTAPDAGARRTYHDVDYALRPDGTAAGVVDGFAVIGDEGGVRASIDAARGYALAGTDRFRLRVRRAKGDRVGFLYLDLLSVGDLLGPGLVPTATAKQLRERLSVTDPLPVVAILSAKPSAALVDFGSRPGDSLAPGQEGQGNAGGGQGDGGTPPGEAGGGAAPTPGAGGSDEVAGPEAGPGSGASPGAPTAGLSLLSAPLLPELPADAWLALGVPDAGRQASELVDPAIDPGLGLDAVDEVGRRLERHGLDLRDGVLPALGGMVLFLRGGSPGQLDGGAVIESLDPVGSRAALARLARVLAQRPGWRARASDLRGREGARRAGFRLDAPGVDRPLYLSARGNRIVVGVGRRAAIDALDAPRKLGDSPGFRAASATLAPSLRPDSFLDLPRALRVLDATSVSRRDAYRVARPVLDIFSFVAFAAKSRIRRFALGVQ
ncbi:MAG: hypothetical protein ACR2ML_13695 [Solirubrobacteraceae bacterium]